MKRLFFLLTFLLCFPLPARASVISDLAASMSAGDLGRIITATILVDYLFRVHSSTRKSIAQIGSADKPHQTSCRSRKKPKYQERETSRIYPRSDKRQRT